MKKIMTVTLHSRDILKPDPEIKFEIKDKDEGNNIIQIMLANKVPLKRAVIVELYEGEE